MELQEKGHVHGASFRLERVAVRESLLCRCVTQQTSSNQYWLFFNKRRGLCIKDMFNAPSHAHAQ